MSETLTPVRLRGHLGAKFGAGVRHLNVTSPGEAIRLLCATVNGFEDYVRASKGGYRIVLKDNTAIPGEHLCDPTGRQEIRIVPVNSGADSNFGEILLGAALIGLAFTGWGAAIPWIHGALIGMGSSMVLGGITKALMSTPNSSDANSTPNSFLFNNVNNTVGQGIPVPVLYGQMTIVPPLINECVDTEAFSSYLFYVGMDGLGNWTGNGDTTPWGASLKCI